MGCSNFIGWAQNPVPVEAFCKKTSYEIISPMTAISNRYLLAVTLVPLANIYYGLSCYMDIVEKLYLSFLA